MRTSLFKRLFVALLLIAVVAAIGWKVLPRWGFQVPWWVLIACFLVIAISSVATMEREEPEPETQPDPDAPIPFRPPADNGGPEGISAADRERFG